MFHELTSGDDTFRIVTDYLVPIQPPYDAFQNFVAAHPDYRTPGAVTSRDGASL